MSLARANRVQYVTTDEVAIKFLPTPTGLYQSAAKTLEEIRIKRKCMSCPMRENSVKYTQGENMVETNAVRLLYFIPSLKFCCFLLFIRKGIWVASVLSGYSSR